MDAKPEDSGTATRRPEEQSLQIAIIRAGAKPAPSWLKCELCERPASHPSKRLVIAHARPERATASETDALVLLCMECWELATRQIDKIE